MVNSEPRAELLTLVHDLARERGIEIPPMDPYPIQQPLYEGYLKSLTLDPDDVDLVLEMHRIPEAKRAEIHGQLLLGLMNASKMSDQDLRALLFIVVQTFSQQRASGLIRTIAKPLLEFVTKTNSDFSKPFAMGVLPLRWFNAQCAIFEGKPILVLAAGSLDLMEIFTTLLQAYIKDARTYAVKQMRQALEHYVASGEVKKADYELGQGIVDFSEMLYNAITTSAERFVIGHEMGHIALGHIGKTVPKEAAPIRQSLPRFSLPGLFNRTRQDRPAADVIKPGHFDEYCADLWGMNLALAAARTANEEAAVPVACAGATIFLGLAMLIEHIAKFKRVEFADSHPPASIRLYLTELLLEVSGNHKQAYIARRSREFIEEIGTAYTGFEMPPMLDRDLNKIAIPVFKHVGIDLSRAKFITEFR